MLWSIVFNICQVGYLYGKKIISSQIELDYNWTKVSYKRGRSTQEEPEREAEHTKESEH
jgi:hypothetical protein